MLCGCSAFLHGRTSHFDLSSSAIKCFHPLAVSIFSLHSIRGLLLTMGQRINTDHPSSNPISIGLFTAWRHLSPLDGGDSRPVTVHCANVFHTKSLFARSISPLPVRRGSATPHRPHPHPHPGGLLVAGGMWTVPRRRSSPPALGSAVLGNLPCLAIYMFVTSHDLADVANASRCFVSLSSAAPTAPPGPPVSRRPWRTSTVDSHRRVKQAWRRYDADDDVEHLADTSRSGISPFRLCGKLRPASLPSSRTRQCKWNDSFTLGVRASAQLRVLLSQ